MRYAMISILMLGTLNAGAALEAEYAPITADNIEQIQQISTIPFGDLADQIFRIFSDTDDDIVLRYSDRLEVWGGAVLVRHQSPFAL